MFQDENKEPSGLTVKWVNPPVCAKCGERLIVKGVHIEDFPYIHGDFRMECPCGEIYLHGIPKRKDIGLALHVMDTNPKEAVAYHIDLGKRICPYPNHGAMLPTKAFGDWVFDTPEIEYQWKCSVCFLTRHELHKRKFPHAEGYKLSDEEKELVMDRLRRMGYV